MHNVELLKKQNKPKNKKQKQKQTKKDIPIKQSCFGFCLFEKLLLSSCIVYSVLCIERCSAHQLVDLLLISYKQHDRCCI